MTMLLSQKYEIFPTKEQKEMLERWLQYCRQTYNSALLDKQRKYKENKQVYTRSDMQKQQVIDKKRYYFLKEVPSQPLQEVFLRLKKAYDGFFRGDTNYPKLKTYKDYNSLTFPQFGFKSNGKHRFAMSFTDNGKLYNKQLASASNNKKVEMVPLKEIQGLTGYIRGGVKKTYPLYIDESAASLNPISVSAGKRGLQIFINGADFINVSNATVSPISS